MTAGRGSDDGDGAARAAAATAVVAGAAAAEPARRPGRVVRGYPSLANRNFRIYLLGQWLSQTGTWMQAIGQGWLVLRLSHDSGTALGVVTALQALPVLFFAPFGGMVVDRREKRRLLMATQASAGLLAAALWLLTETGGVRLWMVYVLALGLGFVNVFDNPVRQTFVLELVGPESLANASALNNATFNASRIFGPAVAGLVIETAGIGPCFLANALSYLAVIGALTMLRPGELYPGTIQARGKGQLREAFAYVRGTPELLVPVLMMFVIGALSFETQVTLPLFAKKTFGGTAATYSNMTTAMGIGAVIGGVLVAARMTPTRRNLLGSTVLLGAVWVVTAMMPTRPLAIAMLLVTGFGSVVFLVIANATLQLSAPAALRGRVMSLWSVAFLGSAPIGGPIVGAVGQYAGPRTAVALTGAAALATAVAAWPSLRRLPGGLAAKAGSHLAAG